jgi:hypothetical protein
MRKLHPDGVCACCGRVGPTWANLEPRPLDFGNGVILEPDTSLPALCDECE